jgi:hypothetical protein
MDFRPALLRSLTQSGTLGRSVMMSAMDENRPPYSLKAPGSPSAGPPRHLPGRGEFPGLDDHLVEAEITRDEIIGGQRVVLSPAYEPHATEHSELGYVVRAHVAPGYGAATDLLTRHDEESDFATDTCVRKKGVDPETGGRFLEELAFEVVSEQKERYVREKAVRMHRRGVRRIFAIWVKDQRVCEWSPESRSWRPLAADSRIEDPSLVAPLVVAALLDAAKADDAVVAALAAKGNPALLQREAAARSEGKAEGEAKGEAKGKIKGEAKGKIKGEAEAILKFLQARGLDVSAAQRQEILRCRDRERLDRWLRRAALAASVDEVLSES